MLIKLIEKNLEEDGSIFEVDNHPVKYNRRGRYLEFEDWSTIPLDKAVITERNPYFIKFRANNEDYIFRIIKIMKIKF